MGFFNFIYKITNILSNKRKFKIFLIISIVILIVFAWARGCFAYSSYSTPEDAQALMNYQLALQESLVSQLRYLYQDRPNGFDETAFRDLCNKLYYFNIFVSPGNYSGNPNVTIFEVFTYTMANVNNTDIFTQQGEWSVGINSGTAYPCMLGDMLANHYYKVIQGGGGRTTPIYVQNNYTFHMPDSCYLVRSTYIDEFLNELGYYGRLNSTTYSTKDEELQAITRSGFNNLNNSINNQTNQMTNSIDNASTSITNSVDNLNNTITDTTTDDSQVGFVSENQQDITSGFFTNLLSQFQTYFTSNTIRSVEFPIPFTNKHITFSNRYVRTLVENNENFRPLLTIVTAWWWFILGLYVIKDIYKKINAIKSGDLTNIENENITTQLL